MARKISIVILNYNGAKFLRDCLNSILANRHHDLEIIVVDNNSPDGSGKECVEEYPSCRFILNEQNVGVPEGLNIGIRYCTGEFTVLLNNDIVMDPAWLDHLLNAYMTHGPAVYQPKLLEMTRHDRINTAGNMINIFGFGFSRGKGKIDVGQYEDIEEISYASGACLFCPTFILREIGPLDREFFAYHEDLDLGWRARLRGYPSYYIPKSIVYHYGSAQWQWSAKKFYLLERNRWIVLLTNYSTKTLIRLLPSLVIIEISILFFFAKKRLLREKLRGYLDILRMSAYLRKRKYMISATRKVSDDAILRSFCYNIQISDEVSDPNNIAKFNKLSRVLCKMAGVSDKVKFVQ